LEAIAQSPYYEHSKQYFKDIPWQLHLILNNAESKEEILAIAQKARLGHLGDTQDWGTAEVRWINEGFKVDDFRVFSNEDWPFTPEIAIRGVQPFGAITSGYIKTPDDSTGRAILEAFTTTTCSRMQGLIASGFLFLRRCTHNKEAAFPLPIAIIDELTQKAAWGVYAFAVASLLEPDLDWPNAVDTLDSIGKRISFQKGLLDNKFLSEEEVKAILDNLASLLLFRPVRSGILRFLATLIATSSWRIDNPRFPIDFDSLPPLGAQSLTILHLFSSTTPVAVGILAEQVINLWEFSGTAISEAEMPMIVNYLLSKETIPEHSIQVMSILSTHPIIDIETKRKILEMLIKQTENRRSGFGSESSKAKLSLAA
jgi:hypothetical protein